jgi:hypothetical protein
MKELNYITRIEWETSWYADQMHDQPIDPEWQQLIDVADATLNSRKTDDLKKIYKELRARREVYQATNGLSDNVDP